jgi:hypothetical protein
VLENGQKSKKITDSERSEGSPQFVSLNDLRTTAEILRFAQDDKRLSRSHLPGKRALYLSSKFLALDAQGRKIGPNAAL